MKNTSFNTVITYGELKELLPSTGTGRVPGRQQLRRNAEAVVSRKTSSGRIEIFDNGFFIFTELDRETVFGVDRCSWRDTYTEQMTAKHEVTDELDPYPWEMILESAGSARLSHNSESREESHSDFSLDAPESENNLLFSVRPEHEIRDEEEGIQEYRHRRSEEVAKAYDVLRDDQKQLIEMYFIKKMRQEDIASLLEINQGCVSRRIATIKKRLERFL